MMLAIGPLNGRNTHATRAWVHPCRYWHRRTREMKSYGAEAYISAASCSASASRRPRTSTWGQSTGVRGQSTGVRGQSTGARGESTGARGSWVR
eukprot:212222-Prorocentrum_minimum.AAC.2